MRVSLEMISAIPAQFAPFQRDANIAQIVVGVAALVALLGAWRQIRLARAIHERQIAYSYLDRFNQPRILRLRAEGLDFWRASDWATFDALDVSAKNRLLVLPNLIEEVASQYNRRLLDRSIAALVVGGVIEALWTEWQVLIQGARADPKRGGDWIFYEWERMQRDTRRRRDREHRRMRRQHARRDLFFGTGK